ncbi:MAG: protein translocase subunit SecD [Acidobacteriota bacterium]
MKKNRGKILLILASFILAGYFLYPTYRSYTIDQKIAKLSGNDSLTYVQDNEKTIKDARANRIKLGLDLQGGMRVVLEVNILKMLEELAKNKDDQFYAIMAQVRQEAQTSEENIVTIFQRRFDERDIRLSRYYGSMRETNNEIVKKLRDESDKAIDRAMEIVRNRVDQYGVSEPTIQKQGGRRIIVELPGVSKEAEVRQLLQGTAMLEFKLMKDPDIIYKTIQAIDTYLANAGITVTDTTKAAGDTTAAAKQPSNAMSQLQKTDTAKAAEGSMTPEQAAKAHPFLVLVRPNQQGSGDAYVSENDRSKVDRILARPDVQRLIPADMAFYYTSKPAFMSEGVNFYGILGLKKTPELTGTVIVNAQANIDPNFNKPIVTMEMNNEGARDWARITGANVRKRMAIVLDNSVFSSPVINSKITGGRSQIEGMENIEEARLLEIILKAGALPAPVEIMEQRSVGPSLGEDSIQAGANSFIYALIITVVFMIVYYRTSGLVANVGLFFNVIFIFAVLAAFHGTLTLPGIAGIVLTIGMAVDANVLINERIREELATSKTLRAAIDAGYSKAFTAIFDSNITTFFSGIVLYQFGTGPVQGFALTLMMGVAANLFTAIVISRVIFDYMIDRGTTSINFG